MNNDDFREVSGSARPAVPRVPLERRLPAFVGGQPGLADLFRDMLVGIVGAGSIGRLLAIHAARLQAGTIQIVDRGHYKPESLLTQAIGVDEVGAAKASSTGLLCKQLSPDSRLFTFDGPVESLTPTAFSGASLVLLATDSLLAEIEVGQRCLHLGIPLIHASVFGPSLLVQIRSFVNRSADGPCPACGFNTAEWDHVNSATTFSCQGYYDGEHPTPDAATGPSTQSVSFLCSLAADLALVQALRLVAKLGGPIDDTLLEYCGYTHRTTVSPLRRRESCPCDHQSWFPATAPQALSDCTPQELVAQTGGGDHHRSNAALDVDGQSFVECGLCSGCGKRQLIRRFTSVSRGVQPCERCGAAVDAEPFFTHRPVPAGILREEMHRPLGHLGAANPRFVVVRSSERTVLFRNS